MCGIVGFGSPVGLTDYNLDFFENMLICDTVRGPHSTGVYYTQGESKHTQIIKQLGNGGQFVESDLWNTFRSKRDKKQKVNFIVGHNRWATAGAITAENAHPFKHGNITLVHNGTIDDVYLLPDNEKFVVDSDNVCHAVNKDGLEETIKNMDGAYALCYHDKSDNTLHMVRNDTRPLYFVETQTGMWLWASEKEMLLWLVNRGRYKMTIKQEFALEPGEEVIFDVKGTFKFKEKKQYVLPTFPKYNSYHYCGNHNSSYSNRSFGNSVVKTTNDNLTKFGLGHLSRGDKICFDPYNFQTFGQSSLGTIFGYNFDHSCYFEVRGYNINKGIYVEDQEMEGVITSCHMDLKSNVPVVVVSQVQKKGGNVIYLPERTAEEEARHQEIADQLAEAFYDDFPFSEKAADETVELLSGRVITRAEWDKGVRNCGICNDHIAFEDAGDAVPMGGSFVCPDCWDEWMI